MASRELIRYNVVPKLVGGDAAWEYEAAENGQFVEAASAIERITQLETQLQELLARIEHRAEVMIDIRKCDVAEILDAGEAQGLIASYAVECLIPDAAPQRWLYLAMEEQGVLTCFGAYAGGELVGFVSVITSVMPHHGKKVATVESLYADPRHRYYGAGNALMVRAELHAKETGCICLTYTARVGSRLDTILALRAGCERSHEMYTKWFQP